MKQIKIFYYALLIFAITSLSAQEIYGQNYATTNGASNKKCGSYPSYIHTPFTGAYIANINITVKYSATENIYDANEFDHTPYGVLDGIGYRHCSGDFNNKGEIWIFLKEVPMSITSVSNTASTNGYTLVWQGNPNALTTGTFGWRDLQFNGASFSGSDLKGADNGANTFFWNENTKLSVLMLYDNSMNSGSASASYYYLENNGITTPLSSRYIGNSANNWQDGTSTMTKYSKPSIRVKIASPLPIELSSFTATPSNKGAEVFWTTESELNNDYFTLSRSWDGEIWEEITQIKGAGNSNSQLNYTYYDRSAILHEVAYYKLRQTDYDGRFEEFGPISVRHLKEKVISIYPNPVKNTLTVNKTNDFKLFDLTGKEVKIQTISPMKFDVRHLKSGVYILRFDDGEMMKLIKE